MSSAELEMIGLAGVYLFMCYALIRAPRLRRPLSVAVAVLFTLVMIAAVVWLPMNKSLADLDLWRPYTQIFATMAPFVFYLGLMLILITVINIIWTICQVITGTGRLELTVLLASTRMQFVRITTALAVIASIGITGYGYFAAHNPEVTNITITSPDLPAQFDGFRIALLADIHVGVGLGRPFVQSVVNQVNAVDPDLVVIAGDLSNGTPAQLGSDLMPLTKLKAGYGVLVTTGNHEFDTNAQAWIDWLDSHNLPVLDNSGTVLKRGTASIDILGINDKNGTAPHNENLAAAAQQLHDTFGEPVNGAGRYRILIAHEPVQVYDGAREYGVNLQLSGHTHGGQLWPLGYVVRLYQPTLSGVAHLNGVTVVTTRGVGAWGPPVRVGAPPEIPIITLRRG